MMIVVTQWNIIICNVSSYIYNLVSVVERDVTMKQNGETITRMYNKDEIKTTGDNLKAFGVRHQQCLVLFISFTIAYSMRSCMGVSLVAMIDSGLTHHTNAHEVDNLHGNISIHNGGSSFTESYNKTGTVLETSGILHSLLFTPPYPKLRWDKKSQDIVLSAFFWGYMILQIPGGQLVHRFGSRYLMAAALFINCIASFCIPWAAYYGGWICTMIFRMLQGLSQACIVPAMHTFFGKWAPIEERARLAGLTLGGQALGTVLGLPITGFLAASPIGWPGIFRFYGILSGLSGFLIWYTMADSPAQHPKISMAEKQYIEESMGQHDSRKKHLPVPWAKIFRCKGMYAIIFAHISQTWAQVTLYTKVPDFMDKVVGVNVKANGLLTALPFLVMFFTNFFFSWLTDTIIIKKILSVTNARKFATSLGNIPAAIGLIALCLAPKTVLIVESLLVFTCGMKISSHVGFQVNHIDISPNFAGTLMSISNFISNAVGSQAPLVAGLLLDDVTDEHQWRRVFYLSAGLLIFSTIMYVLLGTGEKAEWNEPVNQKRIAEQDIEDGKEEEPILEKKEHK